MKAAVVHDFSQPPRYADYPDPVPTAAGDRVLDVVATALHPLVRSRASGAHYSSTGQLPLVPGVDGVVRDSDGALYYVILGDTALGSMAERTLVDAVRCVPLPDGADAVSVAAAMNPVMSSWVALRHRITFEPGARVLILGATGSAGRMAVRVAKLFGAGEVIGAGRDPGRLAELPALGADRVLTLDRLGEAAEADVVLDYLWGPPAAGAMVDMLSRRADRSRGVVWVQIGSMAGAGAEIPSAALRSARLQIVGSGIGSVPPEDFRREIPEIARAVTAGEFDVRTRVEALSEVTAAWTRPAAGGERIVFVP